jgi:NADH:ubiquinone oxidoreductase subunit 3 (subunit A)
MADVWVLLLILFFFAVCVALVRGCDVIIGGDETVEREPLEQFETGARETEAARAAP